MPISILGVGISQGIGNNFTKVYDLIIHVLLDSNSNNPIRPQFCICHESPAELSWYMQNYVLTKSFCLSKNIIFFLRFESWALSPFAKWVRGSCLVLNSTLMLSQLEYSQWIWTMWHQVLSEYGIGYRVWNELLFSMRKCFDCLCNHIVENFWYICVSSNKFCINTVGHFTLMILHCCFTIHSIKYAYVLVPFWR